jgi:hypothetical protein
MVKLNMNLFGLIASYIGLVSCISVGKTPQAAPVIEDSELANELDSYIKETQKLHKDGARTALAPIINSISNFTLKNPLAVRMVADNITKGFLNYAAAAYCPQKNLEVWDCYNCKDFAQQTAEVVYLNNNNFESGGFLGINSVQKMIVMSFKGTKSFRNWLSNLQFKLTDLPVTDGKEIQVHSGFNEAVDAIYPQVRLAVLNAVRKYPSYKLVSTGHSLGGAMATLLAFKVAQEGIIRWENIKIITFGQPRVGNKAFADYLNSKPLSIARVTTKGDLVSTSPGFQSGYYHSQYNIHMDINGNSIPCSLNGEDPLCIEYVTSLNRDSHLIYWGHKINTNCVDQKIDDLNIVRNTKNNILNLWGNFWSMNQNIVNLLSNNY